MLLRSIFGGAINRKNYFLYILGLVLVGGILTQIASEIGPGAFVIAWAIVYLLLGVLDAKRLRDVEVPGVVGPIAALVIIAIWAPFTYDVLIGARLPYPKPQLLSLLQLFYFAGHLYLLFAKGTRHERLQTT